MEQVRREVYQRMISERERIANQFRSEGEGEAANIGGEQEKKLQEITSGAYRVAEETKGKADAEAADIYARAYNRDPDFYRFTKSMTTLQQTMDMETVLTSVQKTNRCITIEEGFPHSGVGSEISAQIMENAFDWLDAPVIRVTGKDVPMPYAANLEKLALPSIDEVVEAAKAVTYR